MGKLKRYKGSHFQEIIKSIKMEVGDDFTIIDKKRVRPKGITKIFKKPEYEITILSEEHQENKMSAPVKLSAINEDIIEKEVKKLISTEFNDLKSMTTVIMEKLMSDNKEVQSDKKFKSFLSRYNKFYNKFLEQGVKENIIIEIYRDIYDQFKDKQEMPEDIYILNSLKKRFQNYFEIYNFGQIEKDSQQQILCFLGISGVGKTSTLLKIATQAKFGENKNVSIITLDIKKMGATKHLEEFVNILEIPFHIADSNDCLIEKINLCADSDLILIDTFGVSINDKYNMKVLAKIFDSINNVQKFLLLNATTKESVLESCIKKYKEVGYDSLIFTKMDETDQLGFFINLLHKNKIPVLYKTFGEREYKIDVIKSDELFHEFIDE